MFVALSGLPRTGSTLLSAILSQNPVIHAEGNSAVCQLMWDMQQSCEGPSSEQLAANRRYQTQDALVRSVPSTYYANVDKKIIVDKCRSWALPANMEMLRRYFDHEPKVIVMTRPIDEIVNSFVRLREANGWQGDLSSDLTVPGSEPIMRSLDGVKYAQETNNGEFHFVTYFDLVNDPTAVLDRIYDFIGADRFTHDFDNVVNQFPEDDSVYGLNGQHIIRSKVGE